MLYIRIALLLRYCFPLLILSTFTDDRGNFCVPRILTWILTPVYLIEYKPLPFFITLPLLALPSRSLLRTGLYTTRYLPSFCRLEVLSLCVARLPTAEAVAGCCLHHIYKYATLHVFMSS